MAKRDKLDSHKRTLVTGDNFEYWFDWAINNLEAAEKEYPELFDLMKEAAQEQPPFFIAAIIEKTPENFSKWKTDIENCLPATRKKKIEQYIELIELLLYRLEFASDIEKNAVIKIRPELLEMEQYFKGLISTNKPTKQQKRTSYLWQNNPDKELPELFKLMKEKFKLIAPETTFKQLEAIFKGQPIESISPVRWHEDNATELLYFISRLEGTHNINHNPKRADYQRMAACFVKPDGTKFNANWKQIKQNIDINLSKDKQKAIDELVKNFS